jgi:cytidine deaminase
LAASDETRLSVVIVNVHPGREDDFWSSVERLDAIMDRQRYCVGTATVRDEGLASCFYLVWHWVNADAARLSHADPEMNEAIARLRGVGLVTHAINGARDRSLTETDDRRVLLNWDRRAGFDRRAGREDTAVSERRNAPDRRLTIRREWQKMPPIVEAARRAREHAEAQFSKFKVGAALETADGVIVTGCNIENATCGLTICAERVAMFKALSDGHREFTRIAVVADTESPTPPCGACRQILWEFGGNLEIQLANLSEAKGTHQLRDLLPLPFDARLL